MLADEPVHDRVEVPDPPVTVVDVRAHDTLVELAVTDRVTLPAKPSIGATVIVSVPITPAFMVTLAVPAVSVKSWTWNVMVAE